MFPRSGASVESLNEENRWCLRCLGFYTGVYQSEKKPIQKPTINYYCERGPSLKCGRCAEFSRRTPNLACLMIPKEQWSQALEIIDKTREILIAEQTEGEIVGRDQQTVKEMYRNLAKATRTYHKIQSKGDQQSVVSETETSMAYSVSSDEEEIGEIHCAHSFAVASGNGRPPNTAGSSKISKALGDIRRLEEEKAEASRRLGRAIWTAGRDPQSIGPADDLVRLVVGELHRHPDHRQGDARNGISNAFREVESAKEAREEAFRRLGDVALAIMPASSGPEGRGSSGSGRAFNTGR
ncbi:hypothetical protein CORC01_08871 [Colletotrichum orchidophilum]|uniref:Uncharacterized protein n=1 Tax=Colletotrichum orchidophilum TaxID=1209926 RepID=A0A1G4B3B1_9PEZI|nr:uncharacterized protein CORC01_08871 [Colletotrichum orchidophilum]OHE95874.1 hypothetical protein CORC01_08871 [Colletotrichum orchidophilum]